MNTQPDFEEFLRLLEKHSVRYMIVGGYAIAFYGFVRFTKDIDVYFLCESDNIRRIRNALIEFGFPEQEIPENTFRHPGDIVKFGIEPVRIDLINEISGVDFLAAEQRIVRGKYGNVIVSFIHAEDLLVNKRSTGRMQDALDAEKLTARLQNQKR